MIGSSLSLSGVEVKRGSRAVLNVKNLQIPSGAFVDKTKSRHYKI